MLSILYFLSGIYGLLLAVASVDGVEYDRAAVFSAAAVLCVILWAAQRFVRPVAPWLAAAAILGCAYYLDRGFLTISEQIQSIGYNASNMHEEALMHASDVTEAMLLMTVAVTVLLFLLEYIAQAHIAAYMLVTAVMVAAPLLGIRLSLPNIFLFAIFQITFWAMNLTGWGHGRSLTRERRRALSGRIGLIAALITAAVFAASVAVVRSSGSTLYDFVFTAEERVANVLMNISSRFSRPFEDGYINRGNNYKNGDKVLHIEMDSIPEDSVYLKTFTGGGYDGRSFQAADEEAPARRDEELVTALRPLIEPLYTSSFYSVFLDTGPGRLPSRLFDSGIVRDMWIKCLREGSDADHVPYFSFAGEETWDDTIEHYYIFDYVGESAAQGSEDAEQDGIEDPQAVTSHEQSISEENSKEVINLDDGSSVIFIPEYIGSNPSAISSVGGIDSGEVSVYMEMTEALQEALDSVGEQVAREYFTDTSGAALTKMRQFVADHPLESLDEITAFIVYTLNSSCVYTTTPGQAPVNRDIAEYFLFESRRGYCQQFASAATLLFRLYGVPARYASGYRVPAEDFEALGEEESGKKTVTVFRTDEGLTWSGSIFGDPAYAVVPQENAADGSDEVPDGGSGEDAKSDIDYIISAFEFYPEAKAEVTDRREHAWTEIYLKGYGWVPVEVTPGKDGEIVTRYPGLDTERLLEVMREHGWVIEREEAGTTIDAVSGTAAESADAPVETESAPEPEGQDGESSAESAESQKNTENDAADGKDPANTVNDNPADDAADNFFGSGAAAGVIRAVGIILAAASAVVCAVLFTRYYRRGRLKKLGAMDAYGIGGQFMKMLHFAGIAAGSDGTEEDFAAKLNQALPEIGGSRAEEMAALMREAAYGPAAGAAGAGTEDASDLAHTGQCDPAADAEAEDAGKAADHMRGVYFDAAESIFAKAGLLKKAVLYLHFGSSKTARRNPDRRASKE